MSEQVFKDWVAACQGRVRATAEALLPSADTVPAVLHDAMRYAVLGGGKRVRPLLVYAVGEITEADGAVLDRVALAIECIHNYSLVHDDLPCMDNDQLRHGLPTAHVRYGEAMAMLAGDALQPAAFTYILRSQLPAEQKVKIVDILAEASSSLGMCGGQAIDLSMVGKKMTMAELRQMHAMKTGALLLASVLGGAWSGKKEDLSDELIAHLTQYGQAIGLLFQIIDDILDVVSDAATLGKTAGKDAKDDKPTYVSILGLDKARELAAEQHRRALCALDTIDKLTGKDKTRRLREIADFIFERNH